MSLRMAVPSEVSRTIETEEVVVARPEPKNQIPNGISGSNTLSRQQNI
jgi:hypothetical protein